MASPYPTLRCTHDYGYCDGSSECIECVLCCRDHAALSTIANLRAQAGILKPIHERAPESASNNNNNMNNNNGIGGIGTGAMGGIGTGGMGIGKFENVADSAFGTRIHNASSSLPISNPLPVTNPLSLPLSNPLSLPASNQISNVSIPSIHQPGLDNVNVNSIDQNAHLLSPLTNTTGYTQQNVLHTQQHALHTQQQSTQQQQQHTRQHAFHTQQNPTQQQERQHNQQQMHSQPYGHHYQSHQLTQQQQQHAQQVRQQQQRLLQQQQHTQQLTHQQLTQHRSILQQQQRHQSNQAHQSHQSNQLPHQSHQTNQLPHQSHQTNQVHQSLQSNQLPHQTHRTNQLHQPHQTNQTHLAHQTSQVSNQADRNQSHLSLQQTLQSPFEPKPLNFNLSHRTPIPVSYAKPTVPVPSPSPPHISILSPHGVPGSSPTDSLRQPEREPQRFMDAERDVRYGNEPNVNTNMGNAGDRYGSMNIRDGNNNINGNSDTQAAAIGGERYGDSYANMNVNSNVHVNVNSNLNIQNNIIRNDGVQGAGVQGVQQMQAATSYGNTNPNGDSYVNNREVLSGSDGSILSTPRTDSSSASSTLKKKRSKPLAEKYVRFIRASLGQDENVKTSLLLESMKVNMQWEHQLPHDWPGDERIKVRIAYEKQQRKKKH